jgi:glycine/D-amino acid oxidase-like deaminating enzyme
MDDESRPGLLWRLTILAKDGGIYFGPKMYRSEKTFKQAVKHWQARMLELSGDDILTMVKEGCARGPWLSLDEAAPAITEIESTENKTSEMASEEYEAWQLLSDAEKKAMMPELHRHAKAGTQWWKSAA